MANDRPARMQAYMLRFWEVRSQELNLPPAWRFSLEDPHSGERIGFSDFESLVEFLQHEIDASPQRNVAGK